jgi:uncharacterized coiled-coil DUF342 family protein
MQTSIDEITIVVGELDNKYYTESEIDSMMADLDETIASKSDSDHVHDDVYYTETEIDSMLGEMQSVIDSKVDAVDGMGLSTNDYTDADKDKLDSIEANANFYEHSVYTSHDLGLYKITVDEEGHVSGATIAEKEDIVALGIPAQDTVYDDSDLKNRIDDLEDGLKNTNEELDGVSQAFESYKTDNDNAVSENATQIEANREAIEGITNDYLTSSDKTQLQDDINEALKQSEENASAIEVLNGEGEGSVKQSINNAFNEFATNITNDDVVNTYKELIDYAAEHGPEFVELVGEVDSIRTNVGKIETDLSDYQTAVSDQFDNVNSIIGNHVNDIQEVLGNKADLDHEHEALYYRRDEIDELLAQKSQVQIITWEDDD